VTAEVSKKPKKKDSESSDSKNTNATPEKPSKPTAAETRTYPAGSYIVRMDQPYSRIADMLLDYQYWSTKDPQKSPYDDTGWTFGELFGVKVGRVQDAKVLQVPMDLVTSPVTSPGGVKGSGAVIAVNNNAETALMTLRYRFRDATFDVAEEPFDAQGRKFNRGSFLIRGVPAGDLSSAASDLGVSATALAAAPSVKTHAVKAPRIAILHTWLSTQDEGWWRQALDNLEIPYSYISTQEVARATDLSSRFDVILFPPTSRSAAAIVAGIPTTWGNPLPWKTTDLTPNIGKLDSTDDIRPGLGYPGLANLREFVRQGGLLIGVMDTAELAVQFGLAPGVAIGRAEKLKVTGSVLRSKIVDAASPIVYGYTEAPALYAYDGPIFNLSNLAGGRGPRRQRPDEKERATGRGTAEDTDRPVGRAFTEPPEEPEAESWEALPLTADQKRNNPFVIPAASAPRVVLRYGDAKDLLISGLVENGKEIAQHPAVIDVPVDKGHIVLFSNNPVWRGETIATYPLVFNAILNFDNLNAGRKVETEK
jgi:hypothetical protein